MWLRRYLAPDGIKPRWARVIDAILAETVMAKPVTERRSRIDWILQTWHESEAKLTKVPKYVKEMLNAGRKNNVGLEALKLTRATKMKILIWHHLAVSDNYTWNKKAARCLRNNHNVRTVGDLLRRDLNSHNCENSENCQNIIETLLNKLLEKFNPNTAHLIEMG